MIEWLSVNLEAIKSLIFYGFWLGVGMAIVAIAIYVYCWIVSEIWRWMK